jgi:L-seryl-tRNA(Ser) seleniumtransferase
LDKVIYHALGSTLRDILLERWERIPALRMIMEPAGRIRERAEALVARLPGLDAELVDGASVIGGGSTPEQSIPTCLIALRSPRVAAWERAIRQRGIIARVETDALLIDLRTVFAEEEEELARCLCEAHSYILSRGDQL